MHEVTEKKVHKNSSGPNDNIYPTDINIVAFFFFFILLNLKCLLTSMNAVKVEKSS